MIPNLLMEVGKQVENTGCPAGHNGILHGLGLVLMACLELARLLPELRRVVLRNDYSLVSPYLSKYMYMNLL
jgi:hypothetical protein